MNKLKQTISFKLWLLQDWFDDRVYNIAKYILERHFRRHPAQFAFFYIWVKDYADKNCTPESIKSAEIFWQAINNWKEQTNQGDY